MKNRDIEKALKLKKTEVVQGLPFRFVIDILFFLLEISLIVYLFLFRDMKERMNILYLCGYVYLAAVVTTDFFFCRKCGRDAEKSCRFFYKWTVVYSVLILAWGIGLNYLELLSGRSEIVFFTIVTICAGGVNLHKRESFLLFPLTILFNYVMELTIGNQPFDLGFLVNYTIFGITLLFISLTKNKSLINETEKTVQLESNALKLKAAVEELNEANKKLRKMSVTDALTGIGNRNALHEYLLKKLSDCREKKRAFCVIMSDLDDFKRINDNFGHKAGDETLKQAANIFVQAAGESRVFRYGGEEFVVVAEEGRNDCIALAEKLRKTVSLTRFTEKKLALTVSMGLYCVVPDADTSEDRCLIRADKALYTAKNGGKNRVCVYREEETPEKDERFSDGVFVGKQED